MSPARVGAATAHQLNVSRSASVPERARGAFVAIGAFDGIHRGHQGLIEATRLLAAEFGSAAIALTFEPHPRTFFRPDEPVFRLTPSEAKSTLFGIVGVADVVEIDFNASLARLSPEAFVRSVLVDGLSVRGVVVGEGFRFGNKRLGDTTTLQKLGRDLGFHVQTLAPVIDGAGTIISSGLVREALRAGNISAANAALGYRWFVTGKVVEGSRRGRELGYPTANLRPPAAFGLRFGIYVVSTRLGNGTEMAGVASFGVRPTFDGEEPLLEVHLFDFDGDLYGRDMNVLFHSWLRPEERFDSREALISQMESDSAEARSVHAGLGSGSEIDRALAQLL